MFRARLHLLRPALFRYLPSNGTRQLSTRISNKNVPLTRRNIARVTLSICAISSIAVVTTTYADSDAERGSNSSDSDTAIPSVGSLVRAYVVYAMCSVPALVEASPNILAALTSIPGVRQITEAFVRVTFFDQFVGADTAEGAIPLLVELRRAKKGVLFAYSVEVDENEATGASFSSPSAENTSGSHTPSASHTDDAHKRIVDEMLHCIDVAAGFEMGLVKKDNSLSVGAQAGRRTWVAVKMTALLPDARALIALSSHIVDSRMHLPRSSKEAAIPFPGAARMEDLDVVLYSLTNSPSERLDSAQINHLRELYGDLVRICTRAKEKGVKIIVDAEYSWYQPAIDALTLALMREFNSLETSQPGEVQPLIYGTFQAYLRRTPSHLAFALEDARKKHYALGVKLVRGAYHPHEIEAHEAGLNHDRLNGAPHAGNAAIRPSLSISPDVEPPVWREKRDTDDAYDRCVSVLVKAARDDVERCAKGRSFLTEKEMSVERGGSTSQSWISRLVGGLKDVNVGSQQASPTPVSAMTPAISVLFGTHNWKSCSLILEELVRNGLATPAGSSNDDGHMIRIPEETAERVAIGQLYGMSDELTNSIVRRTISRTPFVIKYVPYGALADVMPYLSRRAIENKSVLGGGAAIQERQRASRELRKRIFG